MIEQVKSTYRLRGIVTVGDQHIVIETKGTYDNQNFTYKISTSILSKHEGADKIDEEVSKMNKAMRVFLKEKKEKDMAGQSGEQLDLFEGESANTNANQ